ncbi:MAG: DMT family transporter [Candidatus Adiutrix sp.]|jgi:drug/metabolite transporter (DMT)-like permease|nr:DMT family transporter [Candidatus Adiutrix sp.]
MPPKMRAFIYLLIAAFIWGFSYPIGRMALEHLSPFAYGGLRYMFGSLALMPLAWRWRRRPAPMAYAGNDSPRLWLWGGLLSGLCLSVGAFLQLYGLAQSSAGKVAFITALYVSMVPILAFIAGQMPRLLVLAGLGVGLAGLYLLTGGAGGFHKGEGLILAADVFWALQVLITGRLAARVNTWLFSLAQAMTGCAVTLILAVLTGNMPGWGLFLQTLPFTMWGILSVGLAYTCQTVAQRDVSSTSAALVLPLQSVIGSAAGALMLGEQMTAGMIVGALIIVAGCIIAQFAREPVLITGEHRLYRPILRLRVALSLFLGLGTAGLLIWALT